MRAGGQPAQDAAPGPEAEAAVPARRPGLEAPRAGPGDLHGSLDSGVYLPSSPAHWSWLLPGPLPAAPVLTAP